MQWFRQVVLALWVGAGLSIGCAPTLNSQRAAQIQQDPPSDAIIFIKGMT